MKACRKAQPRAAMGRCVLACGLVSSLVGLGGCSGDVNPVKAAYIGAGYGPTPVAAPDFVAKSRREGMDYMPVGLDAPRPNRPRSAADRKALEAELEGARTRNEGRGRAAENAAQVTAGNATAGNAPASR